MGCRAAAGGGGRSFERAAAPPRRPRRALAEAEHQRVPAGALDCHGCREARHGDAAVLGPARLHRLRRACGREMGGKWVGSGGQGAHSRLGGRPSACRGGSGAGRGLTLGCPLPSTQTRLAALERGGSNPGVKAEAALLRESAAEPSLQSRHCRAVTADATCNERGGRRCARERRRSPRRRRCCSRRARRLRRGSRRSAPPTARRRTSRSTA